MEFSERALSSLGAFGDAVIVGSVGSIPIVDFKRVLGMDTLMVGFAPREIG